MNYEPINYMKKDGKKMIRLEYVVKKFQGIADKMMQKAKANPTKCFYENFGEKEYRSIAGLLHVTARKYDISFQTKYKYIKQIDSIYNRLMDFSPY